VFSRTCHGHFTMSLFHNCRRAANIFSMVAPFNPRRRSLYEAVWMSICRESIVNEDMAVDMDNPPDCTDEQSEQAHELYDLSQRQEALRCLLEELICEIADERLDAKMKAQGARSDHE
jgi:hypothetical protein